MEALLPAASAALLHLESITCNWHARRAFLDLQRAVEEVNMAIRDEEMPPEPTPDDDDADIDIMDGPEDTVAVYRRRVDAESDRVAVESLAERLYATLLYASHGRGDVQPPSWGSLAEQAFKAATVWVTERNRRRASP